MPFSITDFRSTGIAKGGARPNLFEVQISGLPNAPFVTALGNGDKTFAFSCKASSIPAQTIGVVEVPYFGRSIKVPGNKTFDNWTVTIINDEEFLISS